MYEGVNVEHTDAGDECVVVFEQKMDMQGGGISSLLWLYRLSEWRFYRIPSFI